MQLDLSMHRFFLIYKFFTVLSTLFLIDEIFRGTNNRERLVGSRSYIQHLVGQNGTGVIATHDLELALDLCDRLLIVQNKQISDNKPEEAIKTGVIQQLFPEDTVKFDPHSRRFTLNK